MEPGRELDALVAEKVMGHRARTAIEAGRPWSEGGPKNYSTDIAAAWELVEKPGMEFLLRYQPLAQLWTAELRMNGCQMGFANADTAPHAICLAALKAVGAL